MDRLTANLIGLILSTGLLWLLVLRLRLLIASESSHDDDTQIDDCLKYKRRQYTQNKPQGFRVLSKNVQYTTQKPNNQHKRNNDTHDEPCYLGIPTHRFLRLFARILSRIRKRTQPDANRTWARQIISG